MTSQSNRQFDTKFLVILVLSELVILHTVYSSVYNYADMKNVVDAFGFGGTLVGLIVGVIAIIYAFYQGTSQQRTNETMIIEIGKLNTVKDEIANTAGILSAELSELKKITEKITQIDQNVSTSKTHIAEISQTLASQSGDSNSSKSVPTSPVDVTTVTMTFLQNHIQFRSNLFLCIDAYLLHNGGKKLNLYDHAKRMFQILSALAPSNYSANDQNKFLDPLTASLNLTIALYRTAGIISLSKHDASNEVIWEWNIVEGQQAHAEILKTKLLASVDKQHVPVIRALLEAE